jgi:prolyl-tRNA synthetase
LNSAKEVGLTVRKEDNFSEWYAQVVLKSGLADYGSTKGALILRPYGYSIWELVREILDKLLKDTGHENGFLPVMIPEALLKKEEEHFRGFNSEVFWVTRAGDNELSEKLALRPTSETIAYSAFARWISSYRDLPFKINFWNTALRAEIKATKPLIRNSEFLWQEGHTVHESSEDALKEVELILKLYKKLIEEFLAIPVRQGLKSNQEKFVGAVSTASLESLMRDGRALQMATSHNLGQNFAKPFDIKYLGKDNVEHYAWQTSWGTSWRLIGALAMVHGDNKGLILPPNIAPIQVIIIPIHKKVDEDLVKDHSRNVLQELENANIRVKIDERVEYTAGWKFNDWEMRGVPLRINVGPRDIEKNKLEISRRDTFEKIMIERKELVSIADRLLTSIQSDLLTKASEFLSQNTTPVADFETFKEVITTKGGFIAAAWCGSNYCETQIKEQSGADIRILPSDDDRATECAECVFCRQKPSTPVLFARSY